MLSWNDYQKSDYIKSNSWLPEYDPSPSGWRVPTREEFLKLCDAGKVTSQWITLNDVTGRKFTDRDTGNSIFLPAPGWRDSNSSPPYQVGMEGNYWSNTAENSNSAYYFTVDRYSYDPSYRVGDTSSRDWGLSIRPVAK